MGTMLPPLKAFRASHKPPLTQSQLAAMVGVDRVTVARWEAGKRRIDEDLLLKVSKLTGISWVKLRPDLAHRHHQLETAR